jgi:benzoyl-CoA 2,3-dioxygenase component B
MNIMNVDYSTKIPNNVNLSEDRQVLKALEGWHPGYMDWWNDMGPEGFQQSLVYLRTAYSVDPRGWAKFDYVKMPEYRWGICWRRRKRTASFPSARISASRPGRKCPANTAPPAPPDRDPGRHRAGLGRAAAPSRQDRALALRPAQPVPGQCRGRPPPLGDGLPAARLFRPRRPRGGRGAAARRSGDADKPRMLGAFNEATPDWLSFFMFTYFTDRDGKMQLHSLAQSGFDPLSRTCRFMLTEEAHHMFVGETGISRVVQRTCEAMKEAGITDPTDIAKVRALGVIDLPTIQKKLNLHYSLSLDLFGSEVSTNAANAFNAGIKGRYKETQIDDDHQLKNATYPVLKLVDGVIKRVDEPALTALNMRLRDDYTQDCVKGMLRWNKIISTRRLSVQADAAERRVPSPDRRVQGYPRHADGVLIDDATWNKRKGEWLPSTADGDFIASLMTPVTEAGEFASWISPPKVGIDNKPGDFEYVKIET